MIRTLAAAALAALLASCASGPPRTPMKVIDRALATAPGAAQPSKIVAAELAFARKAREDGQWTAFREFMAPGALIHGQNGPVDAKAWLASQSDPAQAVQWGPRAVWMSCDGKLAVSRGRFRDPEGIVGTFVTVWQQQDNREYRWIYDAGVPDDPQPAPDPTPEADDNAILVVGDERIQGHVADCTGGAAPASPLTSVSPIAPTGSRTGSGRSPDGTLYWFWSHQPDGARRVSAMYFFEGQWREAMVQDLSSAPTAP